MNDLRSEKPQSRKRNTDDTLKSLSKVLRVLECFSVNDRTLSLANICQRTGLPKSTTHRCVASMREVGFLDQDKERDHYRLGLRLLEFGDIVLANIEVHREAKPILETLRHMTGQTAHLAIFDGLRVVVIHRAETISETMSFIENAPVHCTSLGKAILAFQPEEVLQRIISLGLPRYTDRTIVDPEELRRALREIRKRGYAVDEGEHQPGLRCIGAPIRDRTGRVFAAISVSGPAWQIPVSEVPALAKTVVYQTDIISRRGIDTQTVAAPLPKPKG